jgi:hypothetical protein
VTIVVSAIAGATGIWGLSEADIAYAGAVAGVVLILSRMIIASFTNKGISANLGFLTKVENGISTYVGFILTVITWLTAAIASGAGYALPGISNAELAKIGAAMAIATAVGKAIQAAMQGLNFSSSSVPAAKPPA